MYRILIVEDDSAIAGAIQKQLCAWGYTAVCVEDFRNVMQLFSSFSPQLVLLDISLPFYDGYYWCGEIRKLSKVPVMFISSMADNMNIVMAINMGGDDFIQKPFDAHVLVAKVQAMLRRAYEFERAADFLTHRGAVLNLSDGSLLYAGEKIELTKNEFRILHLLMEEKGRIVRRTQIMDHLWQSDSYIDENTLTVNVTRLRKKLDEHGLTGFIITKKGEGYLVE